VVLSSQQALLSNKDARSSASPAASSPAKALAHTDVYDPRWVANLEAFIRRHVEQIARKAEQSYWLKYGCPGAQGRDLGGF
jgi:hypothetical protein